MNQTTFNAVAAMLETEGMTMQELADAYIDIQAEYND